MMHHVLQDTSAWGPTVWRLLIDFAWRWDTFDQMDLTEHIPRIHKMLVVLASILPCEECRFHFNQVLTDPKTFASLVDCMKKKQVKRWVWIAKSLVNFRNKVPNLEYKLYVNRYEFMQGSIFTLPEYIKMLELLRITASAEKNSKRLADVTVFQKEYEFFGKILSS